ncbi:MAG TPA: hypothetical protein VJM33_11400 [Microthrixaceae bacterium]|nr:hypothetical protein [Microthrixaceae bacterium]
MPGDERSDLEEREFDEPGLDEIERWFLRRGIPHFIADYDTDRRVFTRSLPFLVVVYLLAAAPIASTWSEAATELAISLPILVGTWVVSNLARRRQPFSRPAAIGPWELSVFVIGPALPHLVLGEPAVALAWAIAASVILGLTYVVTSYGLVPLFLWGLRQLMATLRGAGAATTRALPLLLVAVTFFFITAEVWQVFAGLRGVPYGLALSLFLIAGLGFVATSVRGDIEPARTFDNWDEVSAAAATTPAAGLSPPVDQPCEPVPLNLRQRLNVMLVAVTSQLLLSVVVALVIGCFFLVFGFLVIDAGIVEAWTLGEANVWWSVSISGQELVLTEQLVRVSGFLATFSGFYFGVYSVSEPALQEGLSDNTEAGLRELFAARRLYLAVRPDQH